MPRTPAEIVRDLLSAADSVVRLSHELDELPGIHWQDAHALTHTSERTWQEYLDWLRLSTTGAAVQGADTSLLAWIAQATRGHERPSPTREPAEPKQRYPGEPRLPDE